MSMKAQSGFMACLVYTALTVMLMQPGIAEPVQSLPVCIMERLESLAGSSLHIESVTHVSATQDVPAHCLVSGFIERGTRIGFTMGLPDDWNRKYLFNGIGGFAGVLDPIAGGIARGYATATGDTGHRGTSVQDATWALNNPAGIVNHFESGTALAAQALKSLTTAYYESVPAHAYFQGCSAGGRQALVEAERFPGTFDGIIAGAPAWNYSKLLITFIENGKAILQSPDNWVPPQAFPEIDRVVLKQCDKADGVVDGIVEDPKQCTPDLRELLCKAGAETQACLTPAQLGTIRRLMNPRFAPKRQSYFGYLLTGSEQDVGLSWGWSKWFFGTKPPVPDRAGKLNFRGDVLPEGPERGEGPNQFLLGEQFLRYMVMNDPGYDARTFRMGEDTKRLERTLGDFLDADDTHLGAFVRSGGKLLIWHGWSDPAIPPEMSVDLYTRIKRDTGDYGGLHPIDQSVRLFMAPGVQHCGGGSGLTQFDPLGALEQWVEQGQAPQRIVATQWVGGEPARSRPLCPYPETARYRGTGDSDDAGSFQCE